MWFFNKQFYLFTLPSGCCTVRELMGYQDSTGIWHYAIVQYSNGVQSLVVEFSQGNIK
jgi:hypothetical protein